MKPMMACMVAATLAAAPAFAQTTTTPATPVTPAPAPMAPATAPMPAPAPAGMSGTFISKQEMGQMLASKLIGTTVVSQNNETIGDVNDILFERGGQVMAAVIGVGGFLGIGEKDVAVPFQQLEFMVNNPAPAMTNTAPPATTAAPPATMNTTANQPATTGATATMTAAPRDAMPNRVMLKMTKAELQSAPTFAEYTPSAATMPAGGATTTPPRQ